MKLEGGYLAIEDREAIFERIFGENFPAALELDQLFQKTAAMLQEHPKAGRPGRVAGTREFVSHPHYILVYDLQPDCVRILRVLPTSRQWPTKPPRRKSGPRAKRQRS